jgi:phenylacetate-CoA ligase
MTRARLLSAFDFTARRDWIAAFRRFDVAAFERQLRTRPERFWRDLGAARALRLFTLASRRVPAYQAFLEEHRIDPARIRTADHLADVPPTDKTNYIKAYPLAARCWDGRLNGARLIAMSSGTTGDPVLWPRDEFPDFEAAVTHELLYRSLFEIDRYKTLAVIGFPMGLYVSGVATALPSWLVSQKGYDLTIAAVGNDKALLLKLLGGVRAEFEQIVIIGHPFFVKDVIETGRDAGWRWSRTRLRLMFCSEGFSEAWRAHVLSTADGRSSGRSTAVSTYGSSELLLMAYETPLTIRLRRRLASSREARLQLLGEDSVPSLFQYNPLLRYVESQDGELLFTAAGGTPLVRFNLHDRGRLIANADARRLLPSATGGWRPWNLPLLSMSGRGDDTLVFYAVNLYPEHVRVALEDPRLLRLLTGKFTMRKRLTARMDEVLEIHLELAPGVARDEVSVDEVTRRIVDSLQRLNMEYRDASARLGKDMRPHVRVWPYQDATYFKAGLKPRFIVR